MEKPKKPKTDKTVQLTVMVSPEIDDMIRRHIKKKGDLGDRVEAAIRAMYENET